MGKSMSIFYETIYRAVYDYIKDYDVYIKESERREVVDDLIEKYSSMVMIPLCDAIEESVENTWVVIEHV